MNDHACAISMHWLGNGTYIVYSSTELYTLVSSKDYFTALILIVLKINFSLGGGGGKHNETLHMEQKIFQEGWASMLAPLPLRAPMYCTYFLITFFHVWHNFWLPGFGDTREGNDRLS